MANDEDLPGFVLEIKRETEFLIRLFDQAFLRMCGIVWKDEIAQLPSIANRAAPVGVDE